MGRVLIFKHFPNISLIIALIMRAHLTTLQICALHRSTFLNTRRQSTLRQSTCRLSTPLSNPLRTRRLNSRQRTRLSTRLNTSLSTASLSTRRRRCRHRPHLCLPSECEFAKGALQSPVPNPHGVIVGVLFLQQLFRNVLIRSEALSDLRFVVQSDPFDALDLNLLATAHHPRLPSPTHGQPLDRGLQRTVYNTVRHLLHRRPYPSRLWCTAQCRRRNA
mmetsp:Transcript_39170/g.65817  ORF Transcript_39170/g.65817 Transcript_39170/m.65817 type:complete len:219 (+) Transcript_39170:222-878(+)